MTKMFWAALPLAALLCIPTATLGAPKASVSQEVVVTASPREVALAKWSHRIEQNLQDKMRGPRPLGTADYPEGVVNVSFVSRDDGTAGEIAIASSSGNSQLDRSALRSVWALTSLQPLAEGMHPNQKIVAQMLYMNGTSSMAGSNVAKREAALRLNARKRNAWFSDQPETASSDVLVLAASR